MPLLRYWFVCGLLLLGCQALAQRLPRALKPGNDTRLSTFAHRPAAVAATAAATAAASLPRQAVRYTWDTGTTTWANPITEQRTYDAAGQLTQLTSSDSATATPFERQRYTYDARGNLLETVVQTGNGNPWINTLRYQNTYDDQYQLTQHLNQAWTGTDWQTTDGFRYQNTYSGTVLIEQIVQLFAAGAFSNDSRFEYTLGNGQWTQVLAQRWTGTGWMNEEQILDLTWYSWPARQPAGFRVQSWLLTGQWIDFQRAGFTYAANGSMVQLIEEAVGGGWQNFQRFTDPLDAQGNDLGYRQEAWQSAAWVLTDELRAQLRYDSQSRLIRRTEQLYVPLLAQFANKQRINYSDFQAVVTATRLRLPDPGLRLYPVPTTGQLNLELQAPSESGPVTIEIRSVTGQVVQTTLVQPAQGTLRATLAVAALPPGSYWLFVRTQNGPVTGRFQRQ